MKAHVLHMEHIAKRTDWRQMIREDLEAVEENLAGSVSSNVTTISDLSKSLLLAGGKRLRPALVVLSSYAAGGAVSRSRPARVAAAVELLHMAILVHDDVVDNSGFRRGRSTANAYWGNKVSVLSGDCMLAKSFHLLALDGDQRIMQVISDMTIRMSESEVLQAICEHSVEQWRENYWQIIRHKTAGFLSACCRCGAILSEATEDIEDTLAQYGMDLGMSFQLTDDLLDIIGQTDVTGKPVGNDLREGKATLPILLAIEELPKDAKVQIVSVIENRDSTEEDAREACRMIRSTSAIETTRKHARRFAERAEAALSRIPPSEARDAMEALLPQVIDRAS